eukprot:12505871-Heterocapsa_arctica.AAC.1
MGWAGPWPLWRAGARTGWVYCARLCRGAAASGSAISRPLGSGSAAFARVSDHSSRSAAGATLSRCRHFVG